MEMWILALCLLGVSGFLNLDDCQDITSEILESENPEETLSLREEDWKTKCLGSMDLGESLGENVQLEITYQTILLFTDFALIYYNQNSPDSYRAFTYAKTAKDWYNWAVVSDLINKNNELMCLTYSFKVAADLWAWYEGTFADASVILLDFQDVKAHCPNSPVLLVTEFINNYLIPPTASLLKNNDHFELQYRNQDGICVMRSSFAYLSWAMTQNRKRQMSTMILFLNYGTTIFKLQVAKANCWNLIFN